MTVIPGNPCGSGNQYRTEIIDIGKRRTGDDLVVQRFEKGMCVIPLQVGPRGHPKLQTAHQRIRADDRTGNLLDSIDTIGIRRDRVNAFSSIKPDSEPEQKLDLPSTSTLSPYRTRRLTPGDQCAGRTDRLPVPTHLKCHPGHELTHLPRLSLKRITENHRRYAHRDGD